MRFGKNCILSISAWLVMYGLFYVEVSHFNMGSRQAKLLWSFLGIPFGLGIQYLVFGDRLSGLKQHLDWKRLTGRLSWRFLSVKIAFFLINQVAYSAALIAVGLPYLLAAPVSAIAVSVLYYFVSLLFVMAPTKAAKTNLA